MRVRTLTASVALALAAMSSGQLVTSIGAQGVAIKAVTAAERYRDLLAPEQRAKSLYEFASPDKARWHNGPPTMNVRPGLTFGAMTAEQRKAAYAVVQAVLSPSGYQKVLDIMDADTEFGKGGANFKTGPDAYSLAIYGTPSRTAPWEVQVNGHHLGLNVTIIGHENVLAPTLTGALPSTFQRDGKTVRVLGEETDSAFALVNMLTPDQRSKAILPQLTGDLVLGPGEDGKVLAPEGLKGSEMTAQQKTGLTRIMAAWIAMLDKTAADAKMADVRRHVDDTYFAWGGETKMGERAYFRVQGPTVLIEYGPQVNAGRGNRGAAATPAPPLPAPPPGGLARNRDPDHIHTIFRDFTNDYGRGLIK